MISGFLIFQIGVATEYAEHIKQQHAKQSANAVKTKENWLYAFWQWTTHDAVSFYTSTLALFTAVLGISTIGLWWVTWRAEERQASDMEKAIGASVKSNKIAVTNAEQRLRAYVTAASVSLVAHRNPPTMGAYGPIEGQIHTYELSVILKNGGQTPATGVVTNISCRNVPGGLLPDFDFPDSNMLGYGVIGPQGELNTIAITIIESHLRNIAPGDNWVLWGWVEYDDIFTDTRRHRTEFCFRILRTEFKSGELWFTFPPGPKFNATNGDCLRSPST